MINKHNLKPLLLNLFAFALLLGAFAFVTHGAVFAQSPAPTTNLTAKVQIDEGVNGLGFHIPNLSDILTFLIRMFFVIAGLAALLFLLLGAFAWVTSGGEKDAVSAAQQKIQAAVIGLIVIVAVLAIIVTMEQVVFGGKLCFGLSCPASIPTLLRAPTPTG